MIVNWEFHFEDYYNLFPETILEDNIIFPKNILTFYWDEIDDYLYINSGDIIPEFYIDNFTNSIITINKIGDENYYDKVVNILSSFTKEDIQVKMCYLNSTNWFCIIKEDEKVLIVKITNQFRFISSCKVFRTLYANSLITVEDIILKMCDIAIDFLLMR